MHMKCGDSAGAGINTSPQIHMHAAHREPAGAPIHLRRWRLQASTMRMLGEVCPQEVCPIAYISSRHTAVHAAEVRDGRVHCHKPTGFPPKCITKRIACAVCSDYTAMAHAVLVIIMVDMC